MDVNAAGRFLCAGSEVVDQDAYLVFWDVRQPKPLGGYWESHTDELSTVRGAGQGGQWAAVVAVNS